MAPPPPGPRGADQGARNHALARRDLMAFLRALAERHGDVVGFDLGRSPCILVNGAPEVRELFLAHGERLCKPEFVKDSNRGYWGDGLTTLEGEAWRERRQTLRPLFGARAVAARLAVVAECTRDLLSLWEPGAEVDLSYELRVLTARVAARTVLGAELEGWGSGGGRPVLPFAEAFGEDYASAPGGDPTAPLVMVRPRAPRSLDATLRIIDERLAGRGASGGDVLSELLGGAPPTGGLTRDDLVGELVQMLYAGHHTIPSSLVAFWGDLDRHREVARRVAAEADGLCATGDPGPPALGASYCLAALAESMRLHPPAPILYRQVAEPFELAGFAFERGAAVWVAPGLLHHDPRYFPEPERFLPERFLGAAPGSAKEQAYLPFGAGPRTCIGSFQALMQMTLIAVLTASRFAPRSVSGGSARFRVSAR